jgi:Peptidase family M23
MNERTRLSLKLLISHVVLLPLLIVASFFIVPGSLFPVTISQTVLLILLFTGYWEFLGLNFKRIYLLICEILIVMLLIFRLLSPELPGNNAYLSGALILIQIWLFFLLIKIFIVIFKHDRNSVGILFPFKDGRYLITDGGNSKISRLMNYHYFSAVHKKKKTNLSMLYATDIVKIRDSGSNYMPPSNNDYPVFGEKVFSPVSGTVIRLENNIDDNIPYSGNYPYSTGNTIVIRLGTVYMLLGHLKKGSIRVREGDSVSAGDLIAEAGNSGYSERPHIHIQLISSLTENYWTGTGVSIVYKNSNLYKNRLISVGEF